MRRGLSVAAILTLLALAVVSSALSAGPVSEASAAHYVPRKGEILVSHMNYDPNTSLAVVSWKIPQGYSTADYYLYLGDDGVSASKRIHIAQANANVSYVATVIWLARYHYFKLVMKVPGGRTFESRWVSPYSLPPGAVSIRLPNPQAIGSGQICPDLFGINWSKIKKGLKFIVSVAPGASDAYAVYSAYSTCTNHGLKSWECWTDLGTTAAVLMLVPEDAGAAKNLLKDGVEELVDHLGIAEVEKAAEEGASKSVPDAAVLSDELANELKDTGVIKSVENPETGKTENVIPSGSYKLADEGMQDNENINILKDLEKDGLSEETIAKETERGLSLGEIKSNVDYLLNLKIPPEVIEEEVEHGISTSEMVEDVGYFIEHGMSEESVGKVVAYEVEHGLTTRAVREYADDLVEMGVSEDNVGHVIAEAAEHGTTASALTQGLDMFLGSAERLEKETTLTINVNGELKTIKIVIKKGNEDGGLIHWWLRHVIGYEMTSPKKPVTDFWPMGQKIIVNGEAKQLPCVIKDSQQLAQLLTKTLQEMEENPQKYFISQRTGNLRNNFKEDITIPPEMAEELRIPAGSIEKVRLMFGYKQVIDQETNKRVNVYTLESFFPVKGKAVYEYQSWSNNWIQKG